MKVDKHILVTGGTGFVGTKLRSALVAHGHWVSIATRTPQAPRSLHSGVDYVPYLPDLAKYDAVVNLAGENLFAARWNPAVKARLRSSRIDATRALVEALAKASKKPTVLVNASAIGVYGDQGERTLAENAAHGDDYLAELCTAWEREAENAREFGVRVVSLRIGVVLGNGGGALAKMLPPFKLGLGGPIGSGRAWMSWIHVTDLAQLIAFAVENAQLTGPVNAVAPQACTNGDFTKALGRALHRPAFFPLPPFMLKAVFGEVASVLTASQRCVPQAATQAGFHYKFGDIDAALRDLVS